MAVVDRTYAASSMAAALRGRAESSPDTVAFAFVEEDGSERTLTYAELHGQACEVAAAIAAHSGSTPGPALLLFAPGLDYVAALFGCFYAGAPAVPAYPPHPLRVSRTPPRPLAIPHHPPTEPGPTTTALREGVEQWIEGRSHAHVVATDELRGGGDDPGARAARRGAPALLQYTSGSTRTPAGVMLAHEQLLSNADRMQRALELSTRDVV